MTPARKHRLHQLVNLFMLCAMLFSTLAPLAQVDLARAQEATEEPTVVLEPTEPATEAPTDTPVTEEPATETPVIEVTEEIIEEPTTEVTEAVTVEPTAETTTEVPTETVVPTAIPVTDIFTADFEDGNLSAWLLSSGWQLLTEENNTFLAAANPGETATILDVDWAHFLFAGLVRITPENTASIALRADVENYTLEITAAGQTRLLRGTTLLAEGPTPPLLAEGEEPVAVWRKLNIQALGDRITVALDGIVQFSYVDPNPLAAGAIIFSTGATNTGAVAFDDISITKLDEPVEVIVSETPVPTETLEATVEATAEVTEESEATEEPTEAAPEGALPILTANFETDPTGWLLSEGASIVASGDNNQALLLAAGSTFTPADALYLADFRVEARFNLSAANPGDLEFSFRAQEEAYKIALGSDEISLTRENGILATVASTLTADTWYNLSLTTQGNVITVLVDGVEVLTYTDETPLLNGQIAFGASGDVLLDNIVVIDLGTTVFQPTPVPSGLTAADREKLQDTIFEVVSLYTNGEVSAAVELAESSFIPVLDGDQIEVIVRANYRAGASGASITPLVETAGGTVTFTHERYIAAQIPLASIPGLITNEAILRLVQPDRASSTDVGLAPLSAGTGSVVSHSLDLMSVNDWYLASYRGNGATIAVIDTGFQGATSGGEYSCLSNSPGNGNSPHGAYVVQVICDIAPNATVRGFRATNSQQLIDAINNARSNHRVIVIPMDMGVHLGPGDGTDGNTSTGSNNSVYDAITAARNAGVLVITSAGNNRDNGYVSWAWTDTVTFEIAAQDGDTVSLSWNDWETTPAKDGTEENFELSIAGGDSEDRSDNPSGDPGVQLTFDADGTFNVTVTRLSGSAVNEGDYLQLQTTGEITNTPLGVPVNTTSNIGRPGDSVNSFTVGAVCASQNAGFPVLPDSSRGPLYSLGGNQPPAIPNNAAATVKPDIMGMSHVSVSGTNGQTIIGCGGIGTEDFDDNGFNGTSAAAAHVAGMAALLISNPNMDIPSGNGTADALRVYMQTHSISTTTAGSLSADGFNNVYGSGVAVLGNPQPETEIVSSGLLTAINGLPGTTHYVGRVEGSVAVSPQSGTLAQPFFSLPEAIARASAGDSLVLLPGDYVTGIDIGKSVGIYAYNQLNPITSDSAFWSNNTFEGSGGLYASANNVIIDGFAFFPSQREGLFDCCGESLVLAPPVLFRDVTGGQLNNSTFSNYNNVIPVQIENSPGVIVASNTFNDNTANAQPAAALYITASESGGSANPVVVSGNTFEANVGNNAALNQVDGVILVEESAVNFIGNYFTRNNSETIIRVRNGIISAGDGMVNIYSNFFLSNLSGPLVHLKPGPRFRFTNNSVINNSRRVGELLFHEAMINRDDPVQPGWNPDGDDGNWDVHNNLFFDNSFPKVMEDLGVNSTCDALAGGSNNGATNNWIYSTVSANLPNVSGSGAGDCQFALENGSLNNITIFTQPGNEIDPSDDFLGLDPLFGFDTTQPDYYRLGELSIGINAANASVPNSLDDFGGNDRVVDGVPDIGAYELVPLTADPISINRTEDTFDGVGDIAAKAGPPYVTGAFAIELSGSVDGGFPPYSFGVKANPLNYSTDVNDFCGGSGVVVQGSVAYYCPPQHFYTNGVPAEVEFEYRVYDRFGTGPSAFNTITVNIAPDADEDLTTSIGTYNFITEINETFSLRLRPFARYDNFRFSENGHPTRGNQADYPFSYTFTGIAPEVGDNDDLFTSGEISAAVSGAGPDGLIVLTPAEGEVGYLSFSYNVTDTNGSTVTNTIRIEVAGVVPDRGLHDDSSLNFEYTTGWSPTYSERNINNTLHQSKSINDAASFTFIGESFTLYMQAARNSGNYQLRLDDELLTWTSSNGQSRATASEGSTCFTTAKVEGSLIANNDKSQALYTVTCRNLRDGEAHTVEIVNQSSKALSVDAISINFVDDPLLPRIHEVNERNILPMFPGWSLITDKKASNGVALSTSSVGEVQFRFQGSGISFGTGLEKNGAQYDICITPENATEVCTSFDNSIGAPRKGVTWDVYRPFFGFEPLDEHQVRLVIKRLPDDGRMLLDSITVFDEQPTAPLNIGVTENDQIGPIIFSNGRDDSWLFDTRNRKASNSSLHSVAKKTNYAGPFVSFQIPEEANSVLWYRLTNKKDSTAMMICVDRAQGESASGQCRQVDLRNEPNPLVISESDFSGGWGTGFTSEDIHTIELFSLVNESFNVDKIQVVDNVQPLQPSYYEENTLVAGGSTYGFFNNTNTLSGAQFISESEKKASGGAVQRTVVENAGVYFQMNGTGFAANFTQNEDAGNVEMCWVTGAETNIATILSTGTCRTYNNFSNKNLFQSGHAIIGLDVTPALFSVAIRNASSATMDFDSLEIFGSLPTNILTGHDQRFETNFNNRNIDDLFLYFGNGWRTRDSSKASGGSQDEIKNKIGAGIIFTTNGVDTVEIVRPDSKKSAGLEICIDGENCVTYGISDRPIVARLPDTGTHIISVTTTTRDTFVLDAVHVYNYAANPMTPGRYENTSALLKFDENWSYTTGKSYSGGNAQRTSDIDSTLVFHFTGSIFQIGAEVRTANQMRICYVTGFETDASAVDGNNCQTWPSVSDVTDVQTFTQDIDAEGIYTVLLVNSFESAVYVDFVEISNDIGPLVEGFYQETYPTVSLGLAGAWIPESDKKFNGGTAVQSTALNDSLVFEFEGTGFEIGTSNDSEEGGNMLVCYEAGSLSGTPASIDENCYTYNNLGKSSKLVSRSVDGLTNGLYSVRVVNLTDLALLEIDFVRIFNTSLATITLDNAGGYNENQLAAPGVTYLTLSPRDGWAAFSGKKAKKYSGSSYVTVVDSKGKASRNYAGPLAMLSVEVPANGSTTVVLDTGAAGKNNSNQLLICVDNVDESCTISDMTSNQYHTVTLTNSTGSIVTQIVTFRALTPGSFTIDGYQVIANSTLENGLYDDPIMTVGGVIDISSDWQSGVKDKRSFGATVLTTNVNNATLSFDFTGTGFSLITQQSKTGVDFELCYAPTATPSDETCLDLSSRISSKNIDRHGHTIYGLTPDDYTVNLRVNDTFIDLKDKLVVDAVAIFGDVTDGTTALEPGMYDDADLVGSQSPVQFAPELFWDATLGKNGPPKGPWQLTERGTGFVGAIMQVFVEGNALTIYQTADKKSSNRVQVCLVIESDEGNLLECSDFSQNSKRTYFTPIMIYGLGNGEHQVIFENLDSRRFNVDALQVIP